MKFVGRDYLENVDLSTSSFHFEDEGYFVEDLSDDDSDDASCSYSTKKLKTGSSKQAASAISLVNRIICQGKAPSTHLSSEKRKAVEVVKLLSSDDESTRANVQRKVAKNDVVEELSSGDEFPSAKVSFFFVKPFLKRLA